MTAELGTAPPSMRCTPIWRGACPDAHGAAAVCSKCRRRRCARWRSRTPTTRWATTWSPSTSRPGRRATRTWVSGCIPAEWEAGCFPAPCQGDAGHSAVAWRRLLSRPDALMRTAVMPFVWVHHAQTHGVAGVATVLFQQGMSHQVCRLRHLFNAVPCTCAGGCGRPNQVGHRVQGLAPKVFSIELAWQNNQVPRPCRVVLDRCFRAT